MVFVKNLHVFSMVFLNKLSEKSWCFVILGKKECFLDEKSGVLKKSKKIEIFHRYFFGQIKPEIIVFWYSWWKRMFLDQKSEIFKKSEKSTFSKGVSPWFLWKNRMFSHWYFLGKLSQKRFFFDILDGRECFLDQKSEIFKKSEKSKFSKGGWPMFFFKNLNIFSWPFFGQIKQEKFGFFMFWIDKNVF